MCHSGQSLCPVAPFASTVLGADVDMLMTCHTIFITVTCLFMGPSHISEPAISPVSLRSSSPSAFQLGPSLSPDFSPHLTPVSSSFYQPVFLSVLVFWLPLSLTLCNPPDNIDSLLLHSHCHCRGVGGLRVALK